MDEQQLCVVASFYKKTQRTPLKEIVKARREIIELKERGLIYE